MSKLFLLFLIFVDFTVLAQNIISDNRLMMILPSSDKVMVTSIDEFSGTSYFFTSGDNNSKLWDLRSKKMIGELKNENEKRTALYFSVMYNPKANVIVQETVNSINIYHYPSLALVKSIEVDITNETYLTSSLWDYLLILKNNHLSKFSLKSFTHYDSVKMDLSNVEIGISLDSSIVYYCGPKGEFGLADINNPTAIKWGAFDKSKNISLRNVINKNFYVVIKESTETKNEYSSRDKKYFLFEVENQKLAEFQNMKHSPDDIFYDPDNENIIYSSQNFVNIFSLKKGEIIKKYVCQSDSLKVGNRLTSKIIETSFDRKLGIIWILNNNWLRGINLEDFKLKFEFHDSYKSFKRIGEGLILVNPDLSISCITDLNQFVKVETYKTNFLSRIYGVVNEDDRFLKVLTSTNYSKIDLHNLQIEKKLPCSNLLNLRRGDDVIFWEGNFIQTKRNNYLFHISEDSIIELSYEGVYYDIDTRHIFLYKDSKIYKVNVNKSAKDITLLESFEFSDKTKSNQIFQYNPKEEYAYFLKVNEPNLRIKQNYRNNKDPYPFDYQFQLIKKSVKSQSESILELPKNTIEIISLGNNYFLHISSLSRNLSRKEKDKYNKDLEQYTLYKIEENALRLVKKFDNTFKLIDKPENKLIQPGYLCFNVKDNLQIYNIEKDNISIIKHNKFLLNKEEFKNYRIDDKNMTLFLNDFVSNNLIVDLKKNTKVAEFKAHPWQQNSIGLITDSTFYSANDQEIILWNKEFQPIFKLFMHTNGSFHIQDTSGYYSSNKSIVKDLYFTDSKLNIIGFEQIDPFNNRPGILLREISNFLQIPESPLTMSAEQAYLKRIQKLGFSNESKNMSFPYAEISNSNQFTLFNNSESLKLELLLSDSLSSLKNFNIIINEVPLYGSAGISIAHLKKQQWDTTLNVPLSIGENKIQVSVMNALGLENFKYPTYVNYTPTQAVQAKTYYIGIGVNEFVQSAHNLKYCVKDVKDLAKAFSDQNSNTDTILFTNQQVTKENILALKTLLSQTTVNDKVIISCSSHGLLDDSLNFYLATHDVDFSKPAERGLKYEELESLLDGIPARQKLLLLDACNSGENDKTELLKQDLANNERNMNVKAVEGAKGVILQMEEENTNNFKKMNELFVNVRNNTGSVIISAAGGLESALEAIQVDGKTIENGAFTYSILECLKQNQGKELKVNTLKQYAEKRVEEITNGKQKPTSRQETMEIDWGVR